MPKSAHRKVSKLRELGSVLATLPDPFRTGLPAPDSIISVTMPTAAPLAAMGTVAAGKQYTIIHTNEMDEALGNTANQLASFAAAN